MKKILAVSLIFFSVALSIIALAAPSTRSTLKGSKPSWAKSANLASAAATSNQLGFRVYLGWNNAAGAEALARAVSNPHSSSYRHYLTPAQFRQQFAPTAAQVAQVQSWLTSQGFKLVYTPKNNHYVSAEGTIAQAQAAFGTGFGNYKVNGMTLRSPSADVSIPSSLAGIVNAVVGLDQSYEFIHTNHITDSNAPRAVGNAPPTAGFRNSPPLSAFYGELLTGVPVPPYTPPPAAPGYSPPPGFTANPLGLPSVPWTIKGHTPTQVKGAYGISGFTGTGQTVAIIDAYASPTILQDANQWSTNRGIPQFGTAGGGTLTQVVSPGTYNVNFVSSPNNYQDIDAAMNHVVDQHLAQIVSNSYGFLGENLPPGYIIPFEHTLIQGAIEGIGIYFSSGDFGDETSVLGVASTDWPASSPWVTAVGGTSLGVSSTNTRVVETGWGVSNYTCKPSTLVCTRTGWTSGSGGGVSCLFSRPSYQNGTVTITAGPTTQCNGFAGRGVPDIAALADANTGYLVGQTQTFPQTCNPAVTKYDEYRLGGTSLSCPIIAGIMALSDQKAGAAHGFANPFFYANPGKFTDILSVKTAVARRNFNNSVDDCNGTGDRLRTFNDFSGSPTQFTGTGWDNVTGLGVPNGIP